MSKYDEVPSPVSHGITPNQNLLLNLVLKELFANGPQEGEE